MHEDIHKTKQRLEVCIKQIKESEKIMPKNKEYILKFKNECHAQRLTDARVLFYMNRIKKIAEKIDKAFDKMDIDDIKDLLRMIEEGSLNGQYKECTKCCYRIAIKKFFQFVSGKEWNSKEYPETVKWIKTKARKERIEKKEIFTQDEIKRLFSNLKTVKDRALFTTLYESGCRIDEFLNMKIKDIEPHEHGILVNVSGKTGNRELLLISCVQDLNAWLEIHPKRNEPDAFVWIGNKNKIMQYGTVRKKIKTIVKKLKINKKVSCHNFRHSRATHVAPFWTEAIMCSYFGWVLGSKMPSVYVHLAGSDVKNTILRFHGIITDKEKDRMDAKICNRCGKTNSLERDFCLYCNYPLTVKAIAQLEEKKKNDMEGLINFMLKNQMKEELNRVVEVMIEKRVQELTKGKI